MAEWIVEDGIGERRAALIDKGRIHAARIERDSDGIQAGTVTEAILLPADGGRHRFVRLATGETALLTSLPARTSDGAALRVRITRSAIPEAALTKLAVCQPAGPEEAQGPAADFPARFNPDALPVRRLGPHQPDELEAAGWSEVLDAAQSGLVPFDGGLLRLSLTPAMAVFDIDGTLPARDLAAAGALAVAYAIHLFGIGGSIVVDFPTLADKAQRISVADALDSALPPPFERTAINGYGLVQIIRPRLGPNLAEQLQFAPVESAALALLRRAERAGGTGPLTLVANPAVCTWLDARPALTALLARRSGRAVGLRPDARRAIGCVDVH